MTKDSSPRYAAALDVARPRGSRLLEPFSSGVTQSAEDPTLLSSTIADPGALHERSYAFGLLSVLRLHHADVAKGGVPAEFFSRRSGPCPLRRTSCSHS
jgi:hypothetical protein